jgi:Holliday junction resolvasome RuvABC ATP-dependent DNA helicase subunit
VGKGQSRLRVFKLIAGTGWCSGISDHLRNRFALIHELQVSPGSLPVIAQTAAGQSPAAKN